METNQSDKESQKPNDWLPYDDYWILKGRHMIDNSIPKLEKRLKVLTNFLNYLAAGTFLGGISFSTYLSTTNIAVYILFIIPLISIAYAKYKVSVEGGQISFKEVDMRSPTKINEKYFDIQKELINRVKLSVKAVSLATGLTLLCLPFAVYSYNLMETEKITGDYLIVQNDSNSLKIKGSKPNIKKINITFFGKDSKNAVKIPIQTEIHIEKPKNFNRSFNLKNLNIKLDSLELEYYLNDTKINSTFRYFKNIPTHKSRINKLNNQDKTK